MSRNGGLNVEAGCGLGRYVQFLQERGYNITGIELSQEAVDTVAHLAPELDVRQGDVAHLPFEDNSVAGLISLGVVEHFIDGLSKPLRETYRVLKPGYYAVITVPSFNYIRRMKYTVRAHHLHLNPIKSLKRSNLVRRILGRKLITPQYVPYRAREHTVPELFFQYYLTKEEFEEELIRAGFSIVKSIPIAWIDGLYHEFGSRFVTFRNWQFYPTRLGLFLNSLLKKIDFCHNHMHLCVVTK
jgi:SAM-dependent methyltransferase